MNAFRVDSEGLTAHHRLFNGSSLADLCREVFGSAPDDVQLLGDGSNNCGAFKLRVKNQKIKCYECQSPDRARWVERATRILIAARVAIPRILAVVGQVVFAEWIAGKHLEGGREQSVWQRMAAYQAQIHQVRIPSSSPGSREFVHLEWLLKRLEEGGQNYVCRNYLQHLMESLRELTPTGLKPGIVQPDFIKSNVVVTEAGELVIIDNEFLGVGLGFEFDILNTSHMVSAGDEAKRRRYLDAYGEVGDLGTLDEHAAFWDLCYLTKLAGKRFLMNDVAMGRVCLELLETKLHAYVQDKS